MRDAWAAAAPLVANADESAESCASPYAKTTGGARSGGKATASVSNSRAYTGSAFAAQFGPAASTTRCANANAANSVQQAEQAPQSRVGSVLLWGVLAPGALFLIRRARRRGY